MAPDGPTATGEPTTPATSTAPEQGKDSSQAAPESEQGLLIQVDDQDGAGPSPSAPKTPPATTSSFQDHLEPSSYVDPTPPTPTASRPPSRTPSNAASRTNDDGSDTGSAGGAPGDDVETDKTHNVTDDTSEIQSIMDQFSESGAGPGAEEVMSPRLEIASPRLSNPPLQSPSTSQPLQQLQMQHPPRKSSLEPLSTAAAAAAAAASSSSPIVDQMQSLNLTVDAPVPTQQLDEKKGLPVDDEGQAPPPVPPKDDDAGPSSASSMSRPRLDRSPTSSSTTPASPTLHRRPPPDPEPEPALPFDFHRFLEQLRNKKADPVARYLKSFLQEFGKKQWMVHEQVKIISDFLAFIANKMALCEVWAEVPDAEFDNAREGMEKLVMNRLYSQTFSPAIPAPKPIPGAKPKRRGGDPPLGPGRRGQHQEDIERDDILTQKINIYGWVREEHLDIPQIGDSGRRFLKLAQQELLKIKSYRAPRDKIICVLNCCKVIFGLLKHNKSDSSADSFMPMLIFVVLQSNPEHLVSNVQYILRFRNQEKLGGEAGYYLSSLMGAIQFIESMDRTSLTITDAEFDKNVEAAVSAIAERHRAANLSPTITQSGTFNSAGASSSSAAAGPASSAEGKQYPPRTTSLATEPPAEDSSVPMSGLFKTIQKPLSTIGRIFTDDAASPTDDEDDEGIPPPAPAKETKPQPPGARHALSAEEAAARQASAEAAEAQRLHRVEHASVVETLAGMFPDLDRDIISDVVHQKEGRVGLAVDACLALSN